MTNKVELNSNEEALEEAGRITYSRAERMAKGSGEAADDHPYYYDMESKAQVARVNGWLRGTAKRLTINPNDVYQEIKQKLVLLGVVLPNYQITPEDEESGEVAFEAEWYPGYREGEDGGIERTSMSAERIPGGLWLIMNIRMEEGRYSIDMKLVVGAEYFEDEELDDFGELENDEGEYEDEAMSESQIEEAKALFVIFKDNEPYEVVTSKKVADSNLKDYSGHPDNKGSKFSSRPLKGIADKLKKLKPKSYKKLLKLADQNGTPINESLEAMSESQIEEAADLPVKKVKDIKDSSIEKEAKKLLDSVKKSKDKKSVVVFTDFGGQKNVEIMRKDDATYKKMAKEKFGFIVESPKI
jgi:hypothetical protein